MTRLQLPTGWVERLHARAFQLPAQPREALRLGVRGNKVGSVELSLADRLLRAGLPLRRSAEGLHLAGEADPAALPPDQALAGVARWLRTQGLAGRWRDELLAVTDVHTDRPVAAVERAAVRPLGITTHAVHLVVQTPDGRVWAQQRAFDKATDPGLWDTTMGGLRAAGETVHDTLARETWEEAGLHLAQLQALQPHGRLTVRRPLVAPPHGYMVEHVDTFSAMLADDVAPFNQDGEVASFECLSAGELCRRLQDGHFTIEAALVLLRCLPGLV